MGASKDAELERSGRWCSRPDQAGVYYLSVRMYKYKFRPIPKTSRDQKLRPKVETSEKRVGLAGLGVD